MSRLAAYLALHNTLIRVRIAQVQGSSPREEGAEMLVAAHSIHGTIGGGQLEYIGIDAARQMLGTDQVLREMDVPLGPEIGQCCGGRVVLSLSLVDETARSGMLEKEAARDLPAVYIFGAGHVGRALARALESLPLHAILIDSRAEELELCETAVEKRLSPLPESELRDAPVGSAVVVLTHEHSLDFLIASEALKRSDFAYVGMIGSATKRAVFERFMREQGSDTGRLTCPIGAGGLGDKRPEVIATFVAAEVMAAVSTWQSEAAGLPAETIAPTSVVS